MASYKSIWPAPVYVGRFADGETVRLSFHSRAGKPLDFNRGRRIVSAVIGNERGREAAMRDLAAQLRTVDATYGPICPDWAYYQPRHMLAHYAPADLASGFVDWDGVAYPDPHFAPAAVEPAAKAKADPLARVLAAIGKLTVAQREAALAALVPTRIAA